MSSSNVFIAPPSKGIPSKIFLGVISLLILTAFSISGYQIFNKLNTPKVVEQKQLTTLTTNLLQAASRVNQAASPEQKDVITKQMVEVAKERKEVALKQMEEKPEEFLRIALPEKITSTLPEEVQQEVEQEVELEGTLEVLHADNFEQKTSKNYYSIVTEDKKRYSLSFADKEPGLIANAKVKIKGGVKLEDKIVVPTSKDENFQILKQESNVLQAATPTVKKVAVILFKYQGQTSDPYTVDQAKGIVFTNNDSTKNFINEASFGKVTLGGHLRPEGDIFGPYTISVNESNCDHVQQIGLAKDAAAITNRVDLSPYESLILVSYNSSCGISGYYPNLKAILISEPSGFIPKRVAHEFGHKLGLVHPAGYNCTDSGVRVSISNTCSTLDSMDPFDTMAFSQNYYHYNNYFKRGLNWLEDRHVYTTAIDQSYTLDIAPIEKPSTGYQIVRIPKMYGRVNYSYYLEYRQPFGFDNFLASDPVAGGVTIRFAPLSYTESYYGLAFTTFLIDTVPVTTTFSDAPLLAGREFHDPIAGITIRTESANTDKATVKITFGQQACRRANPTVSISPLSRWGNPGDTLEYTLTITNNDSLVCSPTTFTYLMSNLTPPGLLIHPEGNIVIPPGVTQNTTINITSPGDIPSGLYAFEETVVNNPDVNFIGSARANYNIIQPMGDQPPISTPTPLPTPVPVTPIPLPTSGQATPTPTPAPGACSVDIKANGSDGPITISAGTSAALSWTSSGDPFIGPTGPEPWNSAIIGTSGTYNTGSLTTGTYGFGLICDGADRIVRTDTVTINVVSSATPTPIPTAAPDQPPLATPIPTLSPISCGSSYTCRNTADNGTCVTTSIFAGTCSGVGTPPCDCHGPGTIIQCLNSGVNCPGAPTPIPTPACLYGVDHYDISVFCSNLGGGSMTFSSSNPNECSNYPIGSLCEASYGTVTKCTASAACATQPSPSPIPTVTPAPKTVTGITINGLAVNLASPTLNLHLPGTLGQAGVITVPMVVTYSDNTTSTSTLTFNYVPPAPTPTPVPSIAPTVAPTAVPTLTPAPSASPTSTPAPAGPDTTPPSASITSPVSGAVVSGTKAIDVTASDNVGISKVEYRIDNVLLINDKVAPYSANWNTTTYANGSHTILVRAYDLASNRKDATITVNVSN